MAGKVLVLGAHGRFGTHAKAAFAEAGWEVHVFRRGVDHLPDAAEGMDVLMMAQNPGDSSTWSHELMPMHRAALGAAEQAGATVILPGNVYVFGPDSPEVWDARTPHRAQNPLAKLRREMEEMYRASPAQVILLRCGDFLDTREAGNWFERIIAKPLPRGRISYPGPTDRPHAWAFLPDAARAAVALAEKRAELANFEDVPFPGYTLSGEELAQALSRTLGRPVRAGRMSWLPIRLARPFMPVAPGLLEMRYLWDKPQRLDGARLAELLPGFTPTPLHDALARATACLPGGAAAPAGTPAAA